MRERVPRAFGRATRVLTAVLLFMLAEGVNAEIYFIHDGPIEHGSPKVPSETIIYRLDTANERLEQISHVYTHDMPVVVGMYVSSGVALIIDSDFEPDELWAVPLTSPEKAFRVDLRTSGVISSVRYFNQPGGLGTLKLMPSYRTTPPSQFSSVADVPLTSDEPTPVATSDENRELRLSGLANPLVSPSHDILGYRGKPWLELKPVWGGLDVNVGNIPEEVVAEKECEWWNLIANEAGFRVLISVPMAVADTTRELLVEDRGTNTWQSLVIPGERTSPQLINGWLVCHVADADPRTDYERHTGYPPILRDETVMINPMTMQTCRASRRGDWEVLWIEGDTVWYRQEDELYRGRLTENDIVDDKLLIKDPRVWDIHWAFEGKK